MEQNKDQIGAAVRGEAVACKFCDGEGVIHTGIDEAPSRECQRCDGSGIAPVSARAADALDSQPSGKSVAQWLRNHYQNYTNIASLCDALEGGALDSQPAVLAACGACHGSGWVVRDPDIGTDQECFSCDGSGKSDEASSQPTDGGVRNGS